MLSAIFRIKSHGNIISHIQFVNSISEPSKMSASPFAYLMFLVPLEQSLGAGDVLGQIVGGDDGLHVVDPGHEVAEVGQEAVQVVGVIQAHLALLGLAAQALPVVLDLVALGLDLLGLVAVRLSQALRLA